MRALQAIEKRNAGEPVETPAFTVEHSSVAELGGTLSAAAAGWERYRVRPARTVHEHQRSVALFVQMHGDLHVTQIRRSHVREFRETLQSMPRHREGELLKATLPDLKVWGQLHPEAAKISPATINKQLGAVQAIVVWGNENGLVPEDIMWSDPFSKMRVTEDDSERAPFSLTELQMIFSAPLFTGHKPPLGAKGVAGVWLPLLALFTGARQAEIAGLTVADVIKATDMELPFLLITEQLKRRKRLKTKSSQRAIPVHGRLVALGFLEYVETRRRSGETAWLFPSVEPNQPSALAAWSKWFGRYLRDTVGVSDSAKVFHSFRHGFKDAARAGSVAQDAADHPSLRTRPRHNHALGSRRGL